MDFKKLMNTTEYDFLRTDPHLGNRIMLLGVSGSYGYGTNREGSDVDFRGIALNRPSDILGLTTFEQFEDHVTDTVIYSFNKMVNLLLNCNPNTMEILGFEKNQYLICSELGEQLLDNRHMFLSKRAAASFGHYADAQLRRLQNATARDTLAQSDRERHILNSLRNAKADFDRRYEECDYGQAKLYVDQAVTEGLDTEVFLDMTFTHYPLRKYAEMMNTIHAVVKDYDKIGNRNKKKDDNHLNKHAMHLVRLFMMGIDVLEHEEIRTRRPESDLKLLRSIRNGDYMEGSVLNPAFYEIVSDYEKRFAEAETKSKLPDNPDMDQIGRFVEQINRQAIREDF